MLMGIIVHLVVGAVLLDNAGFEGQNLQANWKAAVYKDGREPAIRVDTKEFKEGKQSLCIDAQDPSDVAVYQTLDLPAGSAWRLRSWIKTKDLVARDKTDVGGLVDIQTESGSLGHTPARFGTTDWRQEEVVFRVPAPGTIKVVLFSIGFGKGTGTVWFDGIEMEELPVNGPQAVTISFKDRGARPVDLKQCGQFIEPLCNLIPSMIAQQVQGTSFEEDPPYKVAYKAETDKPYRPWYPDGAVHVAKYALDTENAFNGARSQRIECGTARVRAGISQDGFYTKQGVTYRLRLHARGKGEPAVYASLHGDGVLIAGPVTLGKAGDAWGPAEATLKATKDCNNATLTIEMEGPGTVWLDRVYLIGDDAVLGLWRPDVVEALRAMNAGVIRFGGSAVNAYEWEQSIGPWDTRVPFPTCWGGLEPNFVGMEEFVQLCQHIRVEPLLCLRWHGKKPEDALAQVEYFNGDATTHWGGLRAKNGHAEPYHVKYWQIGNEVGGPEYDASIRAFAEGMKKADSSIKVLTSYPSAETLARGEKYLDYLCPHHYGCADLAGKEKDFTWLREQVAKSGGGRDVRVAVTEWNTTAGDWGLGRGMLQTLSNALWCSRYHNLMHRYADLVEIAIRSNLVDSFGSGVIQTGAGWLYVAPTYYAQQLYTRSAGSHPLKTTLAAELPYSVAPVDVSAVLSADEKILRVYAVNMTADAVPVRFALDGAGSQVKAGTAYTLKDRDNAGTPEVMNTKDDPGRVSVTTQPVDISGGRFDRALDPYSLTLLELTLLPH